MSILIYQSTSKYNVVVRFMILVFLLGDLESTQSSAIEVNKNTINNTNCNSNINIVKAKNLEIERLNLECLELEETCQGLKREVNITLTTLQY